MKGLILKNVRFSAVEYDTQAERIKEELEALGVRADVVRNGYCTVGVGEKITSAFAGYDFCVYLDKDKYLLKALALRGVRTFNCYDAIEVCDDKMLTALALSGRGIKMPETIPAPLYYDPEAVISAADAEKIGNTLGYPLVVKTVYGSRGTGVYLVNDEKELLGKMRELKTKPHLFQKFVPESRGRDLRVIVIGGKVLGGMLRSSESDFRSNVALGGRAEAYPVSKSVERVCVECARILGLDYCGIDLLFGGDGEPIVCEVNSNAFFYGFERATGINVAGAYAGHIVAQMRKN